MTSRRPRTCLHCVLERALRANGAGAAVAFGRSEPVWLPVAGGRIYRSVQRMLREACRDGPPASMKLAVVDAPGKSHVEVTLCVRRPDRRPRVLACDFPRCDPTRLAGGFAEGWMPEGFAG